MDVIELAYRFFSEYAHLVNETSRIKNVLITVSENSSLLTRVRSDFFKDILAQNICNTLF